MKGLTPSEKALTIKTKVVERIQKEYLSYEKELKKETEKLDKYTTDEESAERIKKQEAIIAETKTVFYNVKANLIKEKENLQSMMDDNTDENLPSSETWTNAKARLETVNTFIDEQVLKTN